MPERFVPPLSWSLLRRAALVVLSLLLAWPAQAADDLAALARKEKERRARIAKPVKVLTEDDGKEAAARGAGSVTSLTGEATPLPAERPGAGDSAEASQAAWKKRADSARAAVVDAEKTLARMERDLAVYRSDMTPVTAKDAQDPMRLQKREARIVEMNKQIEAQKAAIAEAKRALAAFEDEARKNGVPAGWLR